MECFQRVIVSGFADAGFGSFEQAGNVFVVTDPDEDGQAQAHEAGAGTVEEGEPDWGDD